ncbi:MAG: extracellular solute-binding protein [Castellaniella sp.]|uniref:Extracellular solute-binding protein n=1 Tax=Castellaniella hirudinis TaxID=1144617 RepID=A0ABV8RYM7_9BURK
MNGMDRRRFLALTSSMGALATAPWIPGLSLAAGKGVSCKDLVVGTWGGDNQTLFDKYITEPYVKPAGGSIIYDVGDYTSRMTKMRASRNAHRAAMDISTLGDIDMLEMSEAGTLAPVDEAHVPNLANVYEDFRVSYAVPHFYSAMALVYNPERMDRPASLRDALNPKYRGRFAFSNTPDLHNVLFSTLAGGGDGSSFDPAYKFLRELRKNEPKVFPSNEALAVALKSGDVWMSCIWKARGLQWKKAGLPLELVFPEEGSVTTTFMVAATRNSKSLDCAYAYLNAALEPAAQRGFAESFGYAPTVRNADLPAELAANVSFTDEERKRFMKLDYHKVIAEKQALLDFWAKEFKFGL